MTEPIHEYVEAATIRGSLVARNRTSRHRMFGNLTFPTDKEMDAFLATANARPGALVLYHNEPVPRGPRIEAVPDDDSPAEFGQEGEEA